LPEEDLILELYRLTLEIEMQKKRNPFSPRLKELENRLGTLRELGEEKVFVFLRKAVKSKFPLKKEEAHAYLSPEKLTLLERKEIVATFNDKVVVTPKGIDIYQRLEKIFKAAR